MNPLTLVKRIQKINSREAALGISEGASWHAKYKESAYVFVGGIPYDLTEGDLLAVFAQYGEIVDVNLVRDKGTGKSKGFAFVAYEDQRSTNLAVDNLNGASVLGRIIRVDHVTNYKKKEEEDEEEAQKKREARGVCRAFQRGQCNRGSSCKFSHDEQRCADTGWGGKDSEPKWEHDKANIPPKPIQKEDSDWKRDERPIRDNSEHQTNVDRDRRGDRVGRRELETNPRKSLDKRESDVETNPRKDHDRKQNDVETNPRRDHDRRRSDVETNPRRDCDRRGSDVETNPRRDHDRRGREERSGRHDSGRNQKDYPDRRGGGEKRSRYDRDSPSQHHSEEDERRHRGSHK